MIRSALVEPLRHGLGAGLLVLGATLAVAMGPERAAAGPGAGASLEVLTNALRDLADEHTTADAGRRTQVLGELVAVAEARRALLAELAETDPAAVLENALTPEEFAGFPPGIRNQLERDVEIEGTLQVLYEDGVESSRLRHWLTDDRGRRRSVHFAQDPPELLSGDRVRIGGVEVPPAAGSEEAGAVVAACCSDDGAVEVLQPAELPNTFGEQRTAVLIVRHQDIDPERRVYTQDEARQLFFGDLGDFFLETSYGRTWTGGDVYGPYTLPVDWTCAGWEVAPAAQAAAAADGFDPSHYDRIVYAHAKIPCNFSGKGTIGGDPSEAWINGAGLGEGVVGLLAHELGHNFGLLHSHSLDCGLTVLGTDCTHGEYGDWAGAMGSNRGHFNPFQKQRLGWLASDDLVVPAGDGVFTLEAYETIPGSLPKALKIPRGTDATTGLPSFYYVEYRQPLGVDAFLTQWDSLGGNLTSGLLVRIAAEGDPNSSYLLNMTPGSLDYDNGPYTEWGDAALAFGESYTDAESGVTISAQWGDGAMAAVAVSLGAAGCSHASPGVSIEPVVGPAVPPGAAVAFDVAIANRDSADCSPTSHDLSVALPNGWAGSFRDASLTLAPGGAASTVLDVTSASDAPDGSYPFEVRVQQSAGGGEAAAVASYVVDAGRASENHPPTAIDDAASTPEGTAVTVPVLLNDWDPDGDSLQISDATAPSRGQLRVDADGTITYTPDRHFKGSDAFTYTVSDGRASASADVVVSVERGGGNGRGAKNK